MKKNLFLLAASLFPLIGQTNPIKVETGTELPAVIVSPEDLFEPRSEFAIEKTTLSSKELTAKNPQSVGEILRSIPSLDVSQNGGPGAQTTVHLRGAESGHVLVLLDGIPLNDPISPGKSFDFSRIDPASLQSIHVLRGPQTTLYGADAIAGVILLKSKTPSRKTEGSIQVEAGSFQTLRGSANVSGNTGPIGLNLSVGALDSQGFSTAASGDEADSHSRYSFMGNALFPLSRNVEISALIHAEKKRDELDTFVIGSGLEDDPNHNSHERAITRAIKSRIKIPELNWQNEFSFKTSDQIRETADFPNPSNPTRMLTSFKSRTYEMEYRNRFPLFGSEMNSGIVRRTEEGSSDFIFEDTSTPGTTIENSIPRRSVSMSSFFLENRLDVKKRYFQSVGTRLNGHPRFGSTWTFRFAPGYHFVETSTKLRFVVGSGIKTPTLYQLYAPDFGNSLLQPEKSVGVEAGFDQSVLNDQLQFGVTGFQTRFSNLIEFSQKFENSGEARTRGAEVYVESDLARWVNLRTDYRFTDARNLATGEELLRRSRHRARVLTELKSSQKWNHGIEVVFVGSRPDIDGALARRKLASYSVVNVTTGWDFSRKIRFFGRVDNFFDRDYEEILGYQTPRFSAFLGTKIVL